MISKVPLSRRDAKAKKGGFSQRDPVGKGDVHQIYEKTDAPPLAVGTPSEKSLRQPAEDFKIQLQTAPRRLLLNRYSSRKTV